MGDFHRFVRLKREGQDPVLFDTQTFFGAFTYVTNDSVPAFLMWLDQLNPTSLALLLVSLVLSAVVTCYWHSGHLGSDKMPRATLLLLGSLLGISGLILGQQRVPDSIFVAAATDPNDGQPVIPNIADPQAVNPQTVCPGYRAVDVTSTANGLTADLTLAGLPCNVYGTDIDALTLLVEYQAVGRLHVEIIPKYIGRDNSSWFVLPEELIPKPPIESDSHDLAAKSDIEFSWSNDPTFSFKVTRKSTSDILFTTENSQIVYEDQFIEFSSSLPENYNLYGLGEVIHGFRLGNNFTRTCLPINSASSMSNHSRHVLRGGCWRCH